MATTWHCSSSSSWGWPLPRLGWWGTCLKVDGGCRDKTQEIDQQVNCMSVVGGCGGWVWSLPVLTLRGHFCRCGCQLNEHSDARSWLQRKYASESDASDATPTAWGWACSHVPAGSVACWGHSGGGAGGVLSAGGLLPCPTPSAAGGRGRDSPLSAPPATPPSSQWTGTQWFGPKLLLNFSPNMC